jgi:dienelactone hydrolase
MPHPSPWSLTGAADQPILGDAHLPDADGPPRGVLVICHGFKGYKDYGFFPHLAAAAASRGLVAHRFNFSHSGMTNHVETFERPELFERDSWSRQLADVQCVLDAIETLPSAERIDRERIGLVGHSRGGLVALLTAGHDTRIGATVALASPSSADNLSDDQKREIREQGYVISPSSRTGQDLRVGRAWLEDIEANAAPGGRLDLLGAVGRIATPLLIAHGSADASVPVDCAREIAEAYSGTPDLFILNGVNHTFNCANPFTGPSPALTQLIAVTVPFLQIAFE